MVRFIFFALFALATFVCSCTYVIEGSIEESPLIVRFIDVGQGLAVLFEYEGKYALYDAGPDSVGMLNKLQNLGVDSLEWVLISHNHRDHANAIFEIIPHINIERLYVSLDTSGKEIRDSVQQFAFRYGIPIDTVFRGMKMEINTLSCFEILWPSPYFKVFENGASAVMRLEYGDAKALFMGDLDSVGEKKLLTLNPTLDASLLQVGHHGSAGSSTLPFLAQVSPEYAVISVGSKNNYGHPAKTVLNKLIYVIEDSLNVFRTDKTGDVVFEMHKDLGVVYMRE